MLWDEVDCRLAANKGGMRERKLVERNGGDHALDMVVGQGAAHTGDRAAAILAPGHQLGQQRVVVLGIAIARAYSAIDTHAKAGWLDIITNRAKRWAESGGWVLGVDAALDRMATRAQLLLRDPERLALGDAQLRLHQIDAHDHLGDGVLDLDAGVHLQKAELAIPKQELQRASAAHSRPRRVSATEAAPISARSAGESTGEGHSSISF